MAHSHTHTHTHTHAHTHTQALTPIKVFILVLYLAVVWADLTALHPTTDKLSRNCRLRLANILISGAQKEKLVRATAPEVV